MVGGVRMIPMSSSSSSAPPTRAFGDGGTPSRSRSASATASTLRSEKGQAAVEFALVVPVFCLIVLALIDFGRVLNCWLDTSHLAAEGARLAAVLGNSPEPGSSGWEDWIRQQAKYPGTTVSACLPNGTKAIGDPIRVTVSVVYPLFSGIKILDRGANITLESQSTMRLERTPTYDVGTC